MSKRNPWTAFYWDDWDADTAHLTLTEQGAYFSLLKHYYRTAKPLPAIADHLHRICRASDQQEKVAVNAVVAQFFVFQEALDSESGEIVGQYANKRADIEIAKCLEISSKRSDAGKKTRFRPTAIAKQDDGKCLTSDELVSDKGTAQPHPQPQPQRKEGGAAPFVSDLKPCEAARMYLEHEDICIPASKFGIADVEAGIKAIQLERKIETMQALEWLLGQARKAKAAGKKVGPEWVRKAGYNDLVPKKPIPLVNPADIRRQQMEAGD